MMNGILPGRIGALRAFYGILALPGQSTGKPTTATVPCADRGGRWRWAEPTPMRATWTPSLSRSSPRWGAWRSGLGAARWGYGKRNPVSALHQVDDPHDRNGAAGVLYVLRLGLHA